MKYEVESFLRSRQAEEPYLEPAKITPAGRGHLIDLRHQAEGEIVRTKDLLSTGDVLPSDIPMLLASIEKFEAFLSDINETLEAPSDDVYLEVAVTGVLQDTVELSYKTGDFDRILSIPREFWTFLGEPPILKILK